MQELISTVEWNGVLMNKTNNKFLLVSPVPLGWNNMLMSLECLMAVAHITNRTLVLPPTIFLEHLDDDKSHMFLWHNIFDVLDKTIFDKHFDNINFIDLPEINRFCLEFMKFIKPLPAPLPMYDYSKFDWRPSTNHWKYFYHYLDGTLDIRAGGLFLSEVILLDNSSGVREQYKDDFQKFKSIGLGLDHTLDNLRRDRSYRDLDSTSKYLIIQDPFHYYWFTVYPGGPKERNIMKKRINGALRFKKEYYDMADSILKNIGGCNAIHVRESFYRDTSASEAAERIHKKISTVLSKDNPLFLATDFTKDQKSFFKKSLEQFGYNILTLEELDLNLTGLEQVVLDQIICSKADIFYGTYGSTFSRRINIMRGLEGRLAYDHTGLNVDHGPSAAGSMPFPWHDFKIDNETAWCTNASAHPQWTMEDE